MTAPGARALNAGMSCHAHSPDVTSASGAFPSNTGKRSSTVVAPVFRRTSCTRAAVASSYSWRYRMLCARTCGVTVTPTISTPSNVRSSRAPAMVTHTTASHIAMAGHACPCRPMVLCTLASLRDGRQPSRARYWRHSRRFVEWDGARAGRGPASPSQWASCGHCQPRPRPA